MMNLSLFSLFLFLLNYNDFGESFIQLDLKSYTVLRRNGVQNGGILSPSSSLVLLNNIKKDRIVRVRLLNHSNGVSNNIGSTGIKMGSIIEYISPKGIKLLCLVTGRQGSMIEVINEAKIPFQISIHKVTSHISGQFLFGDLLRLIELINELKPIQIEKLWENIYAKYGNNIDKQLYNIEYFSEQIYGSTDPLRIYATHRMLLTYGNVFFRPVNPPETSSKSSRNIGYVSNHSKDLFKPLWPKDVQENLRDRAALREFKQRFTKVSSTTGTSSTTLPSPSSSVSLPEVPERVMAVLSAYVSGLELLVAKHHPWTTAGISRIYINETEVNKGKELLEFLGIAPSAKNARKILELMGVWNVHTNIEKFLMQIRAVFPSRVLEEAQYIVDNCKFITDMDERIRRDLRYLRSYAIDNEGASEVDDALSIEHVMIEDSNGQTQKEDKIWIHIADVSRWVKPGSELSLEAERRMSSVYMPDERISMFPEELSSQVLSLGASIDSYALSCGVVLAEDGSVQSVEVCPSKIRITKKLTYTQLDEIIQKEQRNLGMPAYDKEDLTALNNWALIRHKHRVGKGALDVYMRDKTELSLSVKRESKNPGRAFVSGYTVWTNGTSLSLVSEYMILMSYTMGVYCANRGIPVLFKTQKPIFPLTQEDVALQEGETPFLRATRLIQCIRPANDTTTPGLHCSSGSEAYVQCTSPIRRYHDLYNHFRLKASMHADSMGSEYAFRAEEEAGITSLDLMSSAQERLETLNAIKMVSRARESYWLGEYLDRIISLQPQQIFDCMVFGSSPEESSLEEVDIPAIYDVLILQLGTFTKYSMYCPETVPKRGDVVQCHLYRRLGVPQTPYFLLPVQLDLKCLPLKLRSQLSTKSRKIDIDSDLSEQKNRQVIEDEENEVDAAL